MAMPANVRSSITANVAAPPFALGPLPLSSFTNPHPPPEISLLPASLPNVVVVVVVELSSSVIVSATGLVPPSCAPFVGFDSVRFIVSLPSTALSLAIEILNVFAAVSPSPQLIVPLADV